MADTYVDVAPDGTVATSRIGAGDPSAYFNSRRVELPAEGNSIRVTSFAGGQMAVVAGQNDRAYKVWSYAPDVRGFEDIGPCFGRRAVAIASADDGSVWIAVVRRNGICERFINGFSTGEFPCPLGPHGIADIRHDGTVEFIGDPEIDDARQRVERGLLIKGWTEKNGIVGGQLLGLGDQFVVVDTNHNTAHTIATGLCFETHITVLDGGGYAFSYRQLNGGWGVQFLPGALPPLRFEIAPLGKKAVGVIYGSSNRYGYGGFGGNCETLFGNEDTGFPPDDWVHGLGVPAIAGLGAINVPWPMRLGTWHDTQHSTWPLAGPRPHFVYDEHTGERHDGRGDVLLVQCYPMFGELPGLFEARVSRGLDLHPARQKLLVLKFYPGNDPFRFTEDQLVPYFQCYERLLRRPDVQGMLAFDGMRSGLKAHPMWLAAFRAFAAASSGLPEFTLFNDEVAMLKKCEVTIPDGGWTLKSFRNGEQFVGFDRENPHLGTRVRVYVEDGSLRMQIDYPGADPSGKLAGRTGARREVKPCQ